MTLCRPQGTPMSPAIAGLLERCDLDASDLVGAGEGIYRLLTCGDPSAPTAVVALEGRGEDLLLRSLAVDAAARGNGCASRLVDAVEGLAQRSGARRLWLLTETAEAFFARKGYAQAERVGAPSTIRATPQFTDLCPASATLMVKALGPPADGS